MIILCLSLNVISLSLLYVQNRQIKILKSNLKQTLELFQETLFSIRSKLVSNPKKSLKNKKVKNANVSKN